MKEFEVKQIKDLLAIEWGHLVKESQEAGFRMLERLVSDYKSGKNTFNKEGESLFGVHNKLGEIIAIGGLNIDPFSNNPEVGRLRRFYVAIDYRRSGIGTLLLKTIASEAKKHFKTLVLHTETVEADRFYTSFGFEKQWSPPNSTHCLSLESFMKRDV